MLIIPAIDILNQSVVRLSQGNFESVKHYSQSPVEQIQKYFNNGFKWVHIIDLAGSKDGKVNVNNLLTEIKKIFDIKIEFGGGIRSYDDVSSLIKIGIDKIIVGSLSINNKKEFEKIVMDFAEHIIVAIDTLNYNIMIKGWTEDSNIHLFEHIDYCLSKSVNKFLCTDITEDGMLQGPNISLYKSILSKYPNIELTASGGVSNIEDIKLLNDLNLRGVVIGKAIYENKISLKELRSYVK